MQKQGPGAGVPPAFPEGDMPASLSDTNQQQPHQSSVPLQPGSTVSAANHTVPQSPSNSQPTTEYQTFSKLIASPPNNQHFQAQNQQQNQQPSRRLNSGNANQGNTIPGSPYYSASVFGSQTNPYYPPGNVQGSKGLAGYTRLNDGLEYNADFFEDEIGYGNSLFSYLNKIYHSEDYYQFNKYAWSRIRYYIPIIGWLPNYKLEYLKYDLLAGISVASVVVPQALSYAQALVHVDPIHGLLTASFPLIAYAILGTSRQLAIGPEALISILVGSAIRQIPTTVGGEDPSSHAFDLFGAVSGSEDRPGAVPGTGLKISPRIAMIFTLCMMVASINFLLGFFRLGFIDSVLSRPLLRGFILAVALVVMIDMSESLLGIPPGLESASSIILDSMDSAKSYVQVAGQYVTNQVSLLMAIPGQQDLPGGTSMLENSTKPPPVSDPEEAGEISPFETLIHVISHLSDTHRKTAILSLISISFLLSMQALKIRAKSLIKVLSSRQDQLATRLKGEIEIAKEAGMRDVTTSFVKMFFMAVGYRITSTWDNICTGLSKPFKSKKTKRTSKKRRRASNTGHSKRQNQQQQPQPGYAKSKGKSSSKSRPTTGNIIIEESLDDGRTRRDKGSGSARSHLSVSKPSPRRNASSTNNSESRSISRPRGGQSSTPGVELLSTSIKSLASGATGLLSATSSILSSSLASSDTDESSSGSPTRPLLEEDYNYNDNIDKAAQSTEQQSASKAGLSSSFKSKSSMKKLGKGMSKLDEIPDDGRDLKKPKDLDNGNNSSSGNIESLVSGNNIQIFRSGDDGSRVDISGRLLDSDIQHSQVLNDDNKILPSGITSRLLHGDESTHQKNADEDYDEDDDSDEDDDDDDEDTSSNANGHSKKKDLQISIDYEASDDEEEYTNFLLHQSDAIGIEADQSFSLNMGPGGVNSTGRGRRFGGLLHETESSHGGLGSAHTNGNDQATVQSPTCCEMHRLYGIDGTPCNTDGVTPGEENGVVLADDIDPDADLAYVPFVHRLDETLLRYISVRFKMISLLILDNLPEVLVLVVTTTILSKHFDWYSLGIQILTPPPPPPSVPGDGKNQTVSTMCSGMFKSICDRLYSHTKNSFVEDPLAGLLPLAGDSNNSVGSGFTRFINFNFSLISMKHVRLLMLPAILISVIGFVESIAVAKTYAGKFNYSVSPNRELVAFGAANLIGGICGAWPSFGSLGRSAINYSVGARTQLAGLITGIVVILTAIFFISFFDYLPKAVCSSIILVAALKLIELDELFFMIKLRAWTDIGLMLMTFLTTIVISIETGTLLSVGVSLLLVVKYTTRLRLAVLDGQEVFDPETQTFKVKYRMVSRYQPGISTLIVKIEEGLFFGNCGGLKERLRRLELLGGLDIHPGEDPITTVVPAGPLPTGASPQVGNLQHNAIYQSFPLGSSLPSASISFPNHSYATTNPVTVPGSLSNLKAGLGLTGGIMNSPLQIVQPPTTVIVQPPSGGNTTNESARTSMNVDPISGTPEQQVDLPQAKQGQQSFTRSRNLTNNSLDTSNNNVGEPTNASGAFRDYQSQSQEGVDLDSSIVLDDTTTNVPLQSDSSVRNNVNQSVATGTNFSTSAIVNNVQLDFEDTSTIARAENFNMGSTANNSVIYNMTSNNNNKGKNVLGNYHQNRGNQPLGIVTSTAQGRIGPGMERGTSTPLTAMMLGNSALLGSVGPGGLGGNGSVIINNMLDYGNANSINEQAILGHSLDNGNEQSGEKRELLGLRLDSIIFDFSGVTGVDASAALTLLEIVEGYESRGIQVFICKIRSKVREILDKAGIFEILGKRGDYMKVRDAVQAALHGNI